MSGFDRKGHWEQIYQTRQLEEVGWYQAVPVNALAYLAEYQVPKTARIIDVGGGDSLLVDHLLDMGYTSVTVLDISAGAIDRARKRLGEKASRVQWVVKDVVEFEAEDTYDFWYDRAAFHFLQAAADISAYVRNAARAVCSGGLLVVGTFSTEGPTRCSGIEVKQYNADTLTAVMADYFEVISCRTAEHVTPGGHLQAYIYGVFRRF
jgi:2-polyprenyl-3-methyl-5-hydroxy-6-metoxy-1,4-benzoquinol methylase